MLRIMAGMTQMDRCLEEYRKLGFTWRWLHHVSVSSSFWFDSGYMFMSVYRGLVFHALRQGGPWTLVLRSIPSCAGGFWTISHISMMEVDSLLRSILAHASVYGHSWTNFQYFLHEGGFGSCSRALRMMGGFMFLPHFASFFALRPHGRECPFFSPR